MWLDFAARRGGLTFKTSRQGGRGGGRGVKILRFFRGPH